MITNINSVFPIFDLKNEEMNNSNCYCSTFGKRCKLSVPFHGSEWLGFFLPPQRELLDLSTIDVILISNYHCMMALPYITEHTSFSGTVYATEPTFQIGR